jgi:hypothetical protein
MMRVWTIGRIRRAHCVRSLSIREIAHRVTIVDGLPPFEQDT